MTRCGHCGASNPAGARWCGQCYEPFGDAAAAGDPAPAGAAPRATTAEPGDLAGTAGRERGGPVHRDGSRLAWACPTCEADNPLEAGACAVCGTPITAAFAPTGAAREPRRADPRVALAASVLLPGSGHALAGRPATGVARALLFAVWVAGGLVLGSGGGGLLVTGPLLAGAAVLWAGSLLDLANLGRSGPELLGARALLWLVVGVTLLSLAGLAARAAGLS